VIKVEGGEVRNRNGKMTRKKKSLLERGFEAILGVFLAYLSGSATGIAQFLLLMVGAVVVLYAIFAD
jgi:hypothetical protein